MGYGNGKDADSTTTTKAETSSRRARLAVVVAAVAFYALFVFRTSFTVAGTRYFVLFEDAMISMRYARHLADGHGLVWNIGEPPIEGFTNLLWVLWMSVAHKIGLSESKISLFIMLSGVAILLTTGFAAARVARKIVGPENPWVPVAVLASTLFCYPLVFWTLRGMEVGAMTVCVYLLLWLVLENEDEFSLPRTIAMGALTAAALLLRSDSVVPVGLISLYGFLTCKKRWIFAGVIGVFAGGAVGGQTVFRKGYFHESLPNTYFLKLYKISMGARVKRGLFVALEVLTMHLAVPVSIVLAVIGVPGRDLLQRLKEEKALRRMVLLGFMFVMQIAYATYVGGDAWEWMLYANRYMSAGMPALVILVAVVCQRLVAGGPDSYAAFAKRFPIVLALSGFVLVVLNLYGKKFPEPGIAATIVFSKKAFAIGAALLGAGIGLRVLADLQLSIREGLAALKARFASRHTATFAGFVLMALVWLPAHALPLGQWAAQNAAQYADEARYTRLGILIRESTPKDLRIAVAAAGATPYFAQRPTEDLLGKNDRVIAKLEPRGVFSPGHDKWDYHYSLGERKADLIVETVDVNPIDEAYISELGFEKLENEMRLRTTADVKRRDVLGRVMADGNVLATSLTDLGASLPSGLGGADIAIVLVFGLAIGGLARKLVKDEESLEPLSAEPPPAFEHDEATAKALAGAEARAIPTLDGMRGIAVLLVLAFHFAWTFPGDDRSKAITAIDKIAVHMHDFLWSGWTGVDLFFVLSGYLITRGLVAPSKREIGTRLKMFWMRRVLRIFPLYYAFVIVGTIVALALGLGWIPGISYWLYMQNYALAFDEEVMRWTAHFWSLAIEEQFYFVWPLVAVLTPRKKLIPTILVLVPLVVGLRGILVFKGANIGPVAALLHDQHQIAKFVYRCTFTRADGLLLGAFVAVTQREVSHPISIAWRRLRFPIWLGTTLMTAGLYVWTHGLNDYDRRIMGIGYVVLAVFFASSVSLCADAMIGERVRKFLSWGPLVACGKVSYGMYIFHWVLVVLLVPRIVKMQADMSTAMQILLNLGVVVGGIAVIYVLATISFRFFETPFLKLKGKFHD
ncbi:MAG: acyltransferase [Deltaproteobacteria bacterium]|nr:acyltransferase [Deltaproteobacteria bacterium]